jgi:TonB family protein
MLITHPESADSPRKRRISPVRLALAAAASIGICAATATVSVAQSGSPGPRASTQAGARPAEAFSARNYFQRAQLDARPYLVTRVAPEYPPGVPPTGGKARIRLFINERGFVDHVAVVESTQPEKFGEAAASAFRTAQFEPGRRRGAAVKSQMLIEMKFAPLLPKAAK